ncbi:MAG: GDP-L-fucose synthase, partial [Bacteroidales bacterium]|nr:GDP-L-fucose synthase [Bacteroidales bacterium]
MKKNAKIYIAGHKGMVGSAIKRELERKGYNNFVLRTSSELNLLNQQAVADFFNKEKPEYVILAAAKVGGIVANNTYRAQFIYENIQIQNNIIYQSYVSGAKKLLFLGSSCIYPKNAPQPLKEEYLLTSELEYTNEPYAIAKIAGIKMCESYNLQYGTNFISVMPTNLYGKNDNYDLEKSHVLPALIRKMHLGKCLIENNWDVLRNDLKQNPIEGISDKNTETEILNILSKYGMSKQGDNDVTINLWGSGTPLREFLYVDDLADACVFLLENINFSDVKGNNKEVRNTHINIGTGKDLSIADLANLVKTIVGFKGNIVWDTEKPDGTFKKQLDVSKLNNLGWKEKVDLEQGVKLVYE